jgi:NADH:ubiquinone oxidoreductase subunit 4 (subunit M)
VLLVNVAYASAKTMTDLGPLVAAALNVAELRLLTLGIVVTLAVKTPVATIRHTHAEGNDAANSVILAALTLGVVVVGIVRRVVIPLLAEATVTADLAPVAQTLTPVTVLFVALMMLGQTEFEAFVLTRALSPTRALGSRGPSFSRSLVQGLFV